MTITIKVKQVPSSRLANCNSPPVTAAQERLAAQRMKQELVAKMKRRLTGEAKAEDEVEEITEWV